MSSLRLHLNYCAHVVARRRADENRASHNRLISNLYLPFLNRRTTRDLFFQCAFRIASNCKFESRSRG
jgi:hypothetical protein